MYGFTTAGDFRIRRQFAFARNTELAIGTDIAAPAAVIVIGIRIKLGTVTYRCRVMCSRSTLSLIAVLACTTVRAAAAAMG